MTTMAGSATRCHETHIRGCRRSQRKTPPRQPMPAVGGPEGPNQSHPTLQSNQGHAPQPVCACPARSRGARATGCFAERRHQGVGSATTTSAARSPGTALLASHQDADGSAERAVGRRNSGGEAAARSRRRNRTPAPVALRNTDRQGTQAPRRSRPARRRRSPPVPAYARRRDHRSIRPAPDARWRRSTHRRRPGPPPLASSCALLSPPCAPPAGGAHADNAAPAVAGDARRARKREDL